MSAQFIGLTVSVTLADKTKLEGLVTGVIGTQLNLSNVYFFASGMVVPNFVIHGSEIADLKVIPANKTRQNYALQQQGQPNAPNPVQSYQPALPSPLSVSTPASNPVSATSNLPFQDPAILSMGSSSIAPPNSSVPLHAQMNQSLSIQDDDDEEDSEIEYSDNSRVQSSRSNHGRSNNRRSRKKKHDNFGRRDRRDFNHVNGGYAESEDGGWATEDVNDVRDDGEFDFQANLAKFDKKMVFEEIRDNDTTNPNERLVAHNKIKANGNVNGNSNNSHDNINNYQNRNKSGLMQKYGNREMIIQNAQNANVWEGIYSEDDDDEVLHPTQNNASIISQANTSRRRASMIQTPPPPPPSSDNAVHFVLSTSGKQCPCATPVQMVELERTAVSTFGISEEIMIDNAGRAGAQLAIQALGGASRLNSQNHNSLPLVVVLAGNNQAGAKALAAGRHLSNHHVRVIALLLGKDRPDELLPIVKSQSTAFQSSMGKLVTRMEQLTTVLNGLDSPAEIIIDGIQGYQMAIPDFWEDDLTTALSLIDWANHQRASIISIDIPSGLDGSTGQPSTLLSVVKPKWVLSCGLPLTGIINAYLAGNVNKGDWSHYIADVGFPRRAFQKGSMRRFDQVWLGSLWLAPMECVDGRSE